MLHRGSHGGLVGWLAPRGRARRSSSRLVYAMAAAFVLPAHRDRGAGSRGNRMRLYGYCARAIWHHRVGANSAVVVRRYREAEQKRLAAKDFL